MTNWNDRISPIVKSVPPSGIRRFFDIASEMEDVISLGVGEPDFVTPWSIRESCVYGLEQGYTSHTANRGLMELREEICFMHKRRFDLDYDPKTDVLVTVGVSEALDIAMRTILSPGDEILIPEPCYVSYKACATLAGGIPVPVPAKAENDFRITPADLEPHVSPKTKALLIGYPNNPTGAILSKEDLEAIARFAIKHDLIVISDEIYSELTYGEAAHFSIAALPGMLERTIVVNGFSKAYAMTGWRLGYALAPKLIAEQMTKIHQFAIMCAPTTSQYAAISAVKEGDKDIAKMRESYDMRRKFLMRQFEIMGLPCFEPYGAFYVFPSIQEFGMTSDEFCTRLLMEEKLAVVPGTAFGDCGEGFVRISYAYSIDELREAISRIQSFITRLRAK